MIKDPDKLSPKEKIIEGIETLKSFFDSLGEENDIYKQILLEELMKILMEKD
jgi:alcohol dehydrogenase YqhD (iron-dependent ADH family)